jgi:hypothetical protein
MVARRRSRRCAGGPERCRVVVGSSLKIARFPPSVGSVWPQHAVACLPDEHEWDIPPRHPPISGIFGELQREYLTTHQANVPA